MKQPPGIKIAASRHFTVLCVSPNAEDGVSLERETIWMRLQSLPTAV